MEQITLRRSPQYSHTTTLLSNVCYMHVYTSAASLLSIIYKKDRRKMLKKNSKSRHVFLNTQFDNHPTADGRLPMHLDVSDGQGVSFLPVTNHSMHDQKRLLPCFEINFPLRSWWAGPHAGLIHYLPLHFFFGFQMLPFYVLAFVLCVTHQCANGRNVRLFFSNQQGLALAVKYIVWHMKEDFIKKQKPIRAPRRRRTENVELNYVPGKNVIF